MFKKRKASSQQPPVAKTLGLDAETDDGGIQIVRHPIRQTEEEEDEDTVVIDRNKARLKPRSQFSTNKANEIYENSGPVTTMIHATETDTMQSMYSTEAIARMKEQTRLVEADNGGSKSNLDKIAQNDPDTGEPMILSGDDARRFLREDPGYDEDMIQSDNEDIGPAKPVSGNNTNYSEAMPSSNRSSPTPQVVDSGSEDDIDGSDASDAAINAKANGQGDPEQILGELKVLKEKLQAREEEIRTKNSAKSEASTDRINLEEKRGELVQAVKKLSEVESIVRYCKALFACQRLKMVQMAKADDPHLVWQEVNHEFVHPQLIIEKFLPIAYSDSERFSKRVVPVLGNILVPHILARLWTERVEFDGLDSFLRRDEEITNALSKIASEADRDQIIHSLLLGVRERYSEFSILAQSDY